MFIAVFSLPALILLEASVVDLSCRWRRLSTAIRFELLVLAVHSLVQPPSKPLICMILTRGQP